VWDIGLFRLKTTMCLCCSRVHWRFWCRFIDSYWWLIHWFIYGLLMICGYWFMSVLAELWIWSDFASDWPLFMSLILINDILFRGFFRWHYRLVDILRVNNHVVLTVFSVLSVLIFCPFPFCTNYVMIKSLHVVCNILKKFHNTEFAVLAS